LRVRATLPRNAVTVKSNARNNVDNDARRRETDGNRGGFGPSPAARGRASAGPPPQGARQLKIASLDHTKKNPKRLDVAGL
jgi:hypothetical protein